MTEFSSNKLRILILSGNYSPIPGGQSEQATLLAETLLEKGCSVEVISERQTTALPAIEIINGVRVYRLPQPHRGGTKTLFRRKLFGLFLLACRLGIRMIQGNRRYDLCIIRTVSSHAFIAGALRAYKLIDYKTIITAETGGENDEINYLVNMPFSKLIIHYIKNNDFFNCNNSANYDHYLKLGFSQKKITKIYNGVDTTEYKSSSYPEEIQTFSFLAELNREKGIRELLDAFVIVQSQHPNIKLLIGGYGDEEKYINQFILDNKLEGLVNFVGYVERNKKREFYEKGDCFVFPSYSEGFGIVVAEALSYKRLIITTKVADLYPILGDKVLYCKEKDCVDLARQMKNAIDGYSSTVVNYDSLIPYLSINRTAAEFLELY